jgi:serine/threonine protein phosphatase PrpC/CRP-like cAMP-binding protein
MGCNQSVPDKGVVGGIAGGGMHQSSKDKGPMTNSEIQQRIDSIEKTKTATFGGIKVRYAYLSQRGYYPDDAHKPNQDSYSVNHDFVGEGTDAFFGVYDGHGRDGDGCSQFARDQLPSMVAKAITRVKNKESARRNIPQGDDPPPLELSKEQIQNACLKAHLECNRNMHRAHQLDDSLSGTTSISGYIHGRRNRITVCNVGDSRAVLGYTAKPNEASNGSSGLKAVPLSRDQTPYRKDERIRIRATGARILSLDQIEGLEPIEDEDDMADDLELGEELDEGGDPPRVWSPHGEYPGTAFTRSLGDAIAEELGVVAEPEMLTRELTKDDKIVVLASDGVFEFLTNQSVIDICAKFKDPLEACRAVVAESYELWLQYELRTDDITIICMFLDEVEPQRPMAFEAVSSRKLTPEKVPSDNKVVFIDKNDTADAPIEENAIRPVRAHLSKEKSKALEAAKSKMFSEGDLQNPEEEELELSKLVTEKTEEEKASIAEAIRASVMFKDIGDEQREMIYGVMEQIDCKQGDWVIKQGTVGDRFYIVDHGDFEVRIIPDDQEDDGSGGNVVHVYHGSREQNAHPSFGELALMYSAPRAASVVAKTDGKLWALHRYAFRQVLAQQSERKELVRVLKRISLLKNVKPEKIKSLAAAMSEVTFGKGEAIVEQGQVGDNLFVIMSGSCELLHKEGKDVTAATLKPNDFFGEEVLVDERRYAATAVSLQRTNCFKLDKLTLKQTVGNLKLQRKGSNNVA